MPLKSFFLILLIFFVKIAHAKEFHFQAFSPNYSPFETQESIRYLIHMNGKFEVETSCLQENKLYPDANCAGAGGIFSYNLSKEQREESFKLISEFFKKNKIYPRTKEKLAWKLEYTLDGKVLNNVIHKNNFPSWLSDLLLKLRKKVRVEGAIKMHISKPQKDGTFAATFEHIGKLPIYLDFPRYPKNAFKLDNVNIKYASLPQKSIVMSPTQKKIFVPLVIELKDMEKMGKQYFNLCYSNSFSFRHYRRDPLIAEGKHLKLNLCKKIKFN